MIGASPGPPHEAVDGVWIFRSPLWQTNAVLVESDGDVLLCDPALFVPEIEAIGAEVARRAARPATLLLTHADFDHTCGIPHLADAEVVAGPDTAEAVQTGAAAESLAAASEEWGAGWRTELRVDRVAEQGASVACGPWTVEVLPAPSHGREGSAFAVREAGVLLAGDHLSSITIPLLVGLDRAIAANEALLDALERFELRLVVPGHGPAHEPAAARAVAEADLAYLRALRDAAAEAVANRRSPGEALLHVFAVEPPRADTPDFAVYGIRAGNAHVALDEARARA
jgi:glyoxylase-like metal-dependent hydrolase (beta-lactamase superfamily II)